MTGLVISWLDDALLFYAVFLLLSFLVGEDNSLKKSMSIMKTPFLIGLPLIISAGLQYAHYIYDYLHPGLLFKMSFMYIGMSLISASWPSVFGLCPYGTMVPAPVALEYIHKSHSRSLLFFVSGFVLIGIQLVVDVYLGRSEFP